MLAGFYYHATTNMLFLIMGIAPLIFEIDKDSKEFPIKIMRFRVKKNGSEKKNKTVKG